MRESKEKLRRRLFRERQTRANLTFLLFSPDARLTFFIGPGGFFLFPETMLTVLTFPSCFFLLLSCFGSILPSPVLFALSNQRFQHLLPNTRFSDYRSFICLKLLNARCQICLICCVFRPNKVLPRIYFLGISAELKRRGMAKRRRRSCIGHRCGSNGE
jgi:hypothetical protein